MGFKYDAIDGKCPYQAGEIQSDLINPGNYEFLEGSWVNVFDRANLNDHLKCYSVEFQLGNMDFEDEEGAKLFNYSEFSRGKKDTESKVSKWAIRDGMVLNFGHQGDASIGHIEHLEWSEDFASEEPEQNMK